MSIDAAQLVTGAFGGAVASSVLGPLVTQSGARRDSRAEVLRRLQRVEQARWMPTGHQDYRASVIDLESAALVANANREVVTWYLHCAHIARMQSEEAFEESVPKDESGGAIWAPLAHLTYTAGGILSDTLWHPHLTKLLVRRQLRRHREEFEEAASNPEHGWVH